MQPETAQLHPTPTATPRTTESSAALRLWGRLPEPIRAVLSGFLVFFVLQNGWLGFFLLNLKVLPEVPWSVPLGLAWLWFFYQYFNGRWAPASTRAMRRRAMRAPRIGRRQYLWALAFVPVFLVYLTAVIQVAYRFVVIPEDDFDLSMLPWWTLYPSLVMVSINAGVSEEAGFRGYLQGGLERRWGPAVAILATSLLFWLAHLNHASGPARFVQLMAMSVGLGLLARCAGSIWPAVVAHATVDAIYFLAAASSVAPWFVQHPPPFAETGVDASLVAFSAVLLLTLAAGAWILRHLVAIRGPRPEA
jgi:membrane protease YdiL (CAAX protease family)